MTDPKVLAFHTHKFRGTDIALHAVIADMRKDAPELVEANPAQHFRERYTLFDKKSGKQAIVHHAFVYMGGTPPETGNFVPPGELLPLGLTEDKAQRALSGICEQNWMFDTSTDRKIWELLEILEDWGEGRLKARGFNPKSKTKSTWQSLPSTHNKSQWQMSARLLLPMKLAQSIQGYKISHKLHPWLESALYGSTKWVANRDQVHLLTHSNDKFRKLSRSNPAEFVAGELIRVGHIEVTAPGAGIDVAYLQVDSDDEERVDEEEGENHSTPIASGSGGSDKRACPDSPITERCQRPHRRQSPAWTDMDMDEIPNEVALSHLPSGSADSDSKASKGGRRPGTRSKQG
ncbi:hypothetical protein BKA70DRAFT_1230834 [Coprinopsis sp. MPI-PUGE-AT-0042]|nr:hypothetical protein BKA70DRAFT_1230834 [Coprinopsis sp. MPI-PUGE-AT-0042]